MIEKTAEPLELEPELEPEPELEQDKFLEFL
jgi:hypothetical protein